MRSAILVFAPCTLTRNVGADRATSFTMTIFPPQTRQAIQAKVDANASASWVCEQTSDPIQQGDVVAVFHRFHFPSGSTLPVLAVFELKHGKVISQTAYPAP